MCQRIDHTADRCYNRFDRDFKPNSNTNNSALYSSPDIIVNLEWLLDNGATNHVTNDSGNIHNRIEYNGSDKLFVGNGQGLQIANTDSSNLKTIFGNLKLQNILHVPSIKKKNILSIARITSDNNTIVEFDSCFVYMKDKVTKKLLLQGTFSNALYRI